MKPTRGAPVLRQRPLRGRKSSTTIQTHSRPKPNPPRIRELSPTKPSRPTTKTSVNTSRPAATKTSVNIPTRGTAVTPILKKPRRNPTSSNYRPLDVNVTNATTRSTPSDTLRILKSLKRQTDVTAEQQRSKSAPIHASLLRSILKPPRSSTPDTRKLTPSTSNVSFGSTSTSHVYHADNGSEIFVAAAPTTNRPKPRPVNINRAQPPLSIDQPSTGSSESDSIFGSLHLTPPQIIPTPAIDATEVKKAPSNGAPLKLSPSHGGPCTLKTCSITVSLPALNYCRLCFTTYCCEEHKNADYTHRCPVNPPRNITTKPSSRSLSRRRLSERELSRQVSKLETITNTIATATQTLYTFSELYSSLTSLAADYLPTPIPTMDLSQGIRAIHKIQKAYRCHRSRRILQQLREAAHAEELRICEAARVEEELISSIVIQTIFRAYRDRKIWAEYLIEKRQVEMKKRQVELLVIATAGITVLQAIWRGRKERKLYDAKLAALRIVVKVQSFFRGVLARRRAALCRDIRVRNAALKIVVSIQTFIRGALARRRVSRYRDAIKRKEARRQAEIQTAIQTRRLAERKIAREREIRIARHEARRRNALILIATAKEAKEAGEKKQALLAAAEEKEQVRAKQKRTTIRAATLIQTVWRGRQSRKATQMAQLMAFIAVKAKKDEERAVAEHLVAQAEAMLFAAATAKLKEAENREAAKLREAQEAEDRAAMEFLLAQAETEFFATIAIQALWRGRMARSQLTSYLRSCPSPSTSCPSPAIQAHAMFSAAMTEDEAPKNYDSSDEAPKPAPPAYDDSSSSTSLNSASRTKALVKATKRQARRAAAKTTAHHHGLNPTLDEKLVAASKMRRNQETVGIPLTCSINEDGLETSTDVKTILVDFYQKHNPSKIDSIDATLKKFAGKELELFSRLAAKYRVVEKSAAAKKKKNEKSLDPVLASYRQYADTLSDTSKSSGGESAKAQEQLSVLSSFCSCPTNNPESDGSSSADKKLVEIKNSITSSTSSLTTSLTAMPAPRDSLSLVEATKRLTASASSASVSKLSAFEAVGTKSNTPRPKNNVSAMVGLWNEKIQNTFTR